MLMGTERRSRVSCVLARFVIALALLFTGSWMVSTVTAGRADASPGGALGDLGAPPTDAEIQQTVTDTYTKGADPAAKIDVQFDGAFQVGEITIHQIGSVAIPTYPVSAPVTVTMTYPDTTAILTYQNGGDTCEGTDCAFYFYRDGFNHWKIERGSTDASFQNGQRL